MELVHNWARTHNVWDAHLIAPNALLVQRQRQVPALSLRRRDGPGLFVIFGLATAPSLACLWLFYLSLSVVSDIFLGYQWDALFWKPGFLAIFFAPLQSCPKQPAKRRHPARCSGCCVGSSFD